LLLPIAAIVIARLSRLRFVRIWIALAVLAAALVRVALAGSRAAEALHDPLFWGAITVLLVAVGVFTGRWPVVAVASSALAGGTATVATLLPNVSNFDVAFPQVRLDVIRQSIAAFSVQLGIAATVCLMALWLYAIAFARPRNRTERVSAGARSALLVALTLCLLGAMPTRSLTAGWTIALGAVLGLAVAREQMS
jgi:hypothetical protein